MVFNDPCKSIIPHLLFDLDVDQRMINYYKFLDIKQKPNNAEESSIFISVFIR